MGKTKKESYRRGLTACVVVAGLLLWASGVEADPAAKMHLPSVVQGEVEFELGHAVALEAGMRFAMREGGRTVGAGIVSRVS